MTTTWFFILIYGRSPDPRRDGSTSCVIITTALQIRTKGGPVRRIAVTPEMAGKYAPGIRDSKKMENGKDNQETTHAT